MQLKEYAKEEKITYQAAWNRFKAGKISGAYKNDEGVIVIDLEWTVVYYKSDSDLVSLSSFCSDKRWNIDEEVFKGSDLSSLKEAVLHATRIVVSSKDVIPGFDLIHHLCSLLGCEIEIMDENES